jgi:hypothetical protein
MGKITHYRTVFLSDIHLGHTDCKAGYLLDFLDHSRIDTLYLHPEITSLDGILYCNDGDWVESCSALTEDRHGNLRLVYWTGVKVYADAGNNGWGSRVTALTAAPGTQAA